MRIVYSSGDMKPGTVYGRVDGGERWMVGYDPGAPVDAKYLLFSTSDGMLAYKGGADDVAAFLSRGNYLPVEVLEHPRRQK
jgi:hypothetical protein